MVPASEFGRNTTEISKLSAYHPSLTNAKKALRWKHFELMPGRFAIPLYL
jgi:hypothetical protein